MNCGTCGVRFKSPGAPARPVSHCRCCNTHGVTVLFCSDACAMQHMLHPSYAARDLHDTPAAPPAPERDWIPYTEVRCRKCGATPSDAMDATCYSCGTRFADVPPSPGGEEG